MIAGKGDSTLYMYNGLKENFNISKVIIEENPNKLDMLKKRIRKLGFIKVSGQVIFQVYSKMLFKFSKKRIKELKSKFKLNDGEINKNEKIEVGNINSKETKEILMNINPDVVVVNGTRIISMDILMSIEARFINTHMGITPKYRGVHGGYWALVNDDKKNCGSTVHIVDTGIDTGGILYQERIKINKSDNYCTYPLHQISVGIEMMKNALNDIKYEKINIKESQLESKLWYHPNIVTYFKAWIIKGIK